MVSEQSLSLGHPFHPTPKSASGFSEADLRNMHPNVIHHSNCII